MFVIDMQKNAQISEINLSTKLVNGSGKPLTNIQSEGSLDGKSYKTLVNGDKTGK